MDVEATYAEGTLSLSYTVGTPEEATWVNYLILLYPDVTAVPLWTVPLEVIAPPITLEFSFPFSNWSWVGLYAGLYTADGVQASDISWVDTGYPAK